MDTVHRHLVQKISIALLHFEQMSSLYIHHHYVPSSISNPAFICLTWNFNNYILSSSGSTSGIRGFKQEKGVWVKVQDEGGEGEVEVGELGGEAKHNSSNRRCWQLIKPM